MEVIGDIARLNAKRYPDRKALIMGDEHLTFEQLNDQANQLAHRLLSMDIEPGDRLAILSYNCLQYVVISYAVAKCGAVIVPVNFRYKRDELVYVINDCEPKVLLFGPEFISLVEEARTGFASPLHLVAISGEPLSSGLTLSTAMHGQPSSDPAVRVDPAAAFAVTYTSGTTGFPKGVLASHSAYLNTYTGMIVEGDLGPGEITLVCLPLFHNGGMHSQLQPTLVRGGTAIIMPRGFQPDRILDAVERHGVTMTMWVPTQLAMLVNDPGVTNHNLSTLGKIWYGSSPISPTLLRACMDTFKAGFYQWYGQTETGMVSVLRPEDHVERSQCTGREIFNANLRVVDEGGDDVPVGEVGEIISSQVPLGMIGYYNMGEANSRTIRDGWIHTGDLARVEGEGYFTVVDRLTNMIISGAENIYPKEIEDVISSHPGVHEVAVFGIPDEIYGESVCAVVVKKKGYHLGEEDIINFCASRISSYKKPKRVEFIDALPKNPTGKVAKNVLREPYWASRKKRI
jgi:fatty-acyl-CoA synthase